MLSFNIFYSGTAKLIGLFLYLFRCSFIVFMNKLHKLINKLFVSISQLLNLQKMLDLSDEIVRVPKVKLLIRPTKVMFAHKLVLESGQ
jgi:hypothetical protein